LKNTGLFFGSFNPIHVGHMALANYILEYTELDEIWFVVSPHNPLKEKSTLLNDQQRLHMVTLAIGDQRKYKASNIEFKLSQPSYTINTLVHLKEKYPSRNFQLIVGMDSLQTFHKWKNYEEILKSYRLIVYPRLGCDGGKLINHPSVQIVNAPIINISSTMIRDAIKEKKNMQFMVPSESWSYIKEMHFYKK